MFETIKDKLTATKAMEVDLTAGIAAREIGWEVVKHATLHYALVGGLQI